MEGKHCLQASSSPCCVLALILCLSDGSSYLCINCSPVAVPHGWLPDDKGTMCEEIWEGGRAESWAISEGANIGSVGRGRIRMCRRQGQKVVG